LTYRSKHLSSYSIIKVDVAHDQSPADSWYIIDSLMIWKGRCRLICFWQDNTINKTENKSFARGVHDNRRVSIVHDIINNSYVIKSCDAHLQQVNSDAINPKFESCLFCEWIKHNLKRYFNVFTSRFGCLKCRCIQQSKVLTSYITQWNIGMQYAARQKTHIVIWMLS